MDTMRERFASVTSQLLAEDPRLALVLADIGAAGFTEAEERHPDRVVNVGIREQLLIGVGGGMALTGLRPIMHTLPASSWSAPSSRSSWTSATRAWAGCW